MDNRQPDGNDSSQGNSINSEHVSSSGAEASLDGSETIESSPQKPGPFDGNAREFERQAAGEELKSVEPHSSAASPGANTSAGPTANVEAGVAAMLEGVDDSRAWGKARFSSLWDRNFTTLDSRGHRRTDGQSNSTTRIRPIKRPSSGTSDRLRPLPREDVNRFVSTLQSEHILVVSCEDDFTLLSAFFALYEHERFIKCDTAQEILEFELEAILEQELAESKPDQMLVINAGGEKTVEARGYLLGLWNALNKTHIQQVLRDAKKNLLVLAVPSLFGGETELVQRLEGVAHWQIPFMQPLLQSWFPVDHEEIRRRIEAQQKQERWPRDDRLLLERIKQYGEPERLRAALESDGVGRIQPPVSNPDQLPILNKTVLYVATFFPALPAEDFEHVLLELLGDAEEESQKQPPHQSPEEAEAAPLTPEEATSSTPEGSGPHPTSPQKGGTRRLRDIWEHDYVSIMRACKLEIRRQENSTFEAGDAQKTGQKVVFVDPDLLDASRRLFEGTLLFDHLKYVRRVRELGLLFRSGQEVVQSVIRLMVDMAIMRPALYGRGWLLELIAVAGPQKIVNADGLGLPEQFLAMVINSKHGEVRSAFYQILYQLLSEMLKHETLHAMVKGLLDDLMKSQEGQEAVLEIARRLRSAPEFNVFYWLKRLLDEGRTPDIRLTARNIVITSAQSFHMVEVLNRVHEWLPPIPVRGRTLEQLPHSVRVAAELIVALTDLSIVPPDRGASGLWPVSNRFFSRLASSNNAQSLPVIIDWLFRPETELLLIVRPTNAVQGLLEHWLAPSELRRKLDDGGEQLLTLMVSRWDQTLNRVQERFPRNPVDRASNLFHALLLAHWAVILQGLEEEPVSEGTAYLRQILTNVNEVCDQKQKRRLSSFWTALEESLIETLGALSEGSQAYGQERRDARRHLRSHLRGLRRRVRGLVCLFLEVRHEGQS